MTRLKDKVMLITGGNSGIGRATAILAAQEGARVVIGARDANRGQAVVDEITATGGDALFVPTDVAQPSAIAALVQATVETFGRLDCAFNNAAEIGRLAATHELSEADFDHTIAVNMKGVWCCMKYEIDQMLRQEPPGGAIVNTSSLNGFGGFARGALYSATKAGVLSLTKVAAAEYGQRGIRVNALAAGAFWTPMLEEVIAAAANRRAKTTAEIEQGYKDWSAVGRIGRPEEAAEVVIWLCSDGASYVTGHSMIVDGGASASLR